MARKKNINNEENDLEYYKTAALFWETYAKNVEAELAKQGKKTRFENDAGLSINSTANEDTEIV